MSAKLHSERKHSKLSASGAERWFNCPGSVELSEGMPDKDSAKSKEGTFAHEILETTTRQMIAGKKSRKLVFGDNVPKEMVQHAFNAASFLIGVHEKAPRSELLVETRIQLRFIHPEMFGTFDGAVVDHFGILHVFDYKYGTHPVSPKENLQMLFYGIGLAHEYDWNFKRAKLWIMQPRRRAYDGPVYWELPITELKGWVPTFKKAVREVERNPRKYVEGEWCWFCKAKSKCPIKQQGKLEAAKAAFSANPIQRG